MTIERFLDLIESGILKKVHIRERYFAPQDETLVEVGRLVQINREDYDDPKAWEKICPSGGPCISLVIRYSQWPEMEGRQL